MTTADDKIIYIYDIFPLWTNGQAKLIRFNVHIQSKLLEHMPVMGTLQ